MKPKAPLSLPWPAALIALSVPVLAHAVGTSPSSDRAGHQCWHANGEGLIDLGALPQRLGALECQESGGVVADGIPVRDERAAAAIIPPPTTSVPYHEPPDAILDILERTGIGDRPYRGIGGEGMVDGAYDCDDFAADTTSHLDRIDPSLGTFTIVLCYEDDLWEPGDRFDYAHAITDIHFQEGPIVWVEPQGMRPADVDGNDDGQVTFYTSYSPGLTPTEGRCALIVYPNAATAEADYGAFDQAL